MPPAMPNTPDRKEPATMAVLRMIQAESVMARYP